MRRHSVPFGKVWWWAQNWAQLSTPARRARDGRVTTPNFDAGAEALADRDRVGLLPSCRAIPAPRRRRRLSARSGTSAIFYFFGGCPSPISTISRYAGVIDCREESSC